MASCKTCNAPITWGKDKGARYVPLDEDPNGTIALLDGRLMIRTTVGSFAELPSPQRDAIPADMEPVWREALDGPRYREHSRSCVMAAAMRLDAGEAV